MKKIFTLGLLLISTLAHAELEVIQLHHRSAEELLPVIRPLLDPGDVANGMSYQLILRTSPRHLEEVRELLHRLDVAARSLKVTVMQDVDDETAARLTRVSGDVGLSRDARVRIPAGGNNDGLNIELGQGRDRINANIVSTRSLEHDRKTQQLRVLEGNRALVKSGQSVPVPQRRVIQRWWGTEVIDSTEYRQVDSGFYVIPRVSGERVTLEISTQNDSLSASGSASYPVAHMQRTASTVSGYLGEWIALGGIDQQRESDAGSLSGSATGQSQSRRGVLVKVELID